MRVFPENLDLGILVASNNQFSVPRAAPFERFFELTLCGFNSITTRRPPSGCVGCLLPFFCRNTDFRRRVATPLADMLQSES